MNRENPSRLVLLAFFLGSTTNVHSNEEDVSLKQLVDQATVSMPITTTPATFLLGSAGESVPRLSSFRAFSTQIAQAFDEKGEVVNSISAEISPALALENLSWDDIVESQLSRLWARTTFSVAINPGSDSENQKSAVGIQSILYAPAMDGALLKVADNNCRGAAESSELLKKLGPPPVLPDEPTRDQQAAYLKGIKEWEKKGKELRDKARSSIEKCQTEIDAILSKWNQPMVSLGVGGVYNSSQADSSAYWLTAAYGADFGDEMSSSSGRIGYLFTAHARNTSNVQVSTDNDESVSGDESLFGVNLKIGNSKFSFIAEYSVLDNEALSDDRKRSVVGMEYKLGDDTYLTLGVGKDSGVSEEQQSVISGLKWGFGKAPVLGIGG